MIGRRVGNKFTFDKELDEFIEVVDMVTVPSQRPKMKTFFSKTARGFKLSEVKLKFGKQDLTKLRKHRKLLRSSRNIGVKKRQAIVRDLKSMYKKAFKKTPTKKVTKRRVTTRKVKPKTRATPIRKGTPRKRTSTPRKAKPRTRTPSRPRKTPTRKTPPRTPTRKPPVRSPPRSPPRKPPVRSPPKKPPVRNPPRAPPTRRPPKSPPRNPPKVKLSFNSKLKRGTHLTIIPFARVGNRVVRLRKSPIPIKKGIDLAKKETTVGKYPLAQSIGWRIVGTTKAKDLGRGNLKNYRKKRGKDPLVQEYVPIRKLSTLREKKAIQLARAKKRKK